MQPFDIHQINADFSVQERTGSALTVERVLDDHPKIKLAFFSSVADKYYGLHAALITEFSAMIHMIARGDLSRMH